MKPTQMPSTLLYRVKKATMHGLLSSSAQRRIIDRYPRLSLYDWLRLWWSTRGITA